MSKAEQSNPDTTRKSLCVTASLMDSRAFKFLLYGNNTEDVEVYSSNLETLPSIGSFWQVYIGGQFKHESDGILRSELFHQLLEHARQLVLQIFGERQSHRSLTWNLFRMNTRYSPSAVNSAPLSKHDSEYLSLPTLWNCVFTYLRDQHHTYDIELTSLGLASQGREQMDSDDIENEVLNIIGIAILEVYSWERECTFSECHGQDTS
ncbi:hypothetical protein VNI00_009164 [Paramarasmius palmivorus]|uniref:Uncharacterized protein n=1 Tax=Paramarasmius palmivorus TaxID=297713 RepID=A0AAW0CP81_9AGAR